MMIRKLYAAFYLALLCFPLYAKTPVIIDTDMGFDDWVAILYVLKNKDLDIKAIMVDCNGLTYCPQGGENASKLAGLLNQLIPVYLGRENKNLANYTFPKALREYSSAMAVPGFTNLESYSVEKKPAAEALVEFALQAAANDEPLVILSIGTAVNLADSLTYAQAHRQQEQFKRGIKRIYKAGGAFGKTVRDKAIQGHLSNRHISGNLSIPGFFATNNTMAEWNVYSAVDAMQTVLQSGIALTWISINTSDIAHITPEALAKLEVPAKKDNALKFSLNAAKQSIRFQGGWDKVAKNFDFWDTAATIAAFNSDVVTESYKEVELCLNTQGREYSTTEKPVGTEFDYHRFPKVDSYFYGALLVNLTLDKEQGSTVCDALHAQVVRNDVINAIDVNNFYRHFIDMGREQLANSRGKKLSRFG